ncbi:NAD-dependent epimerase/dehydratase family protein [Spirillospora albida]|uniref:NAD-dependent epimerase/dehydratase family protein n=1 Tax=Spirillospora albida TaxID=58123 RepID=UPI0006898269|nr:NAD(P)-dependent oxidoreductase [Spirillospora albida]
MCYAITESEASVTIENMTDGSSHRPTPRNLIVVTGVCGFIGSHVAEALLGRDGMAVLGVDRRTPGDDSRTAAILAELQSRPGFDLVLADVGDAAVAAELRKASAVVHLAAPTSIAESWGSGFADQAASLLSSHRLLSACGEAQVPRLVVASSAHVYGPVDGAVGEDVPPSPSSPYGVVKLATERLAAAHAQRPGSTMSTVALRFFTAFGPRVNPDMVVARMFHSARTGERMPLYGDGTAPHTWTHVDDLVEAVLRAIDLPLAPGQAEVVNVAGGDEASLVQVGELVERIVGTPVVWEPADQRPGDSNGTVADLAHAERVLNYVPKVTLLQGLESLWQDLRHQYEESPSAPR